MLRTGRIVVFLTAAVSLSGCGDFGVRPGPGEQAGARGVLVCTVAGRTFALEPPRSRADFRIKNGTPVKLGDCSHVVRLDIRFADGAESVCSGTLLGAASSSPVTTVLTAAHCVTPQRPRSITVSQPALNVSTTASHYRAFGGNPGLHLDRDLDLAVVYLRGPLPGTRAARLATQPATKGMEMIAMGYGYDARGTDGNGNLGSLLAGWVRVDIPGGPNQNVRTLPSVQPPNDPRSQETCAGDSGGPLVAANDVETVYGVLSGGNYRGFPSCRNSADSYWQPLPQRRAYIDEALERGTEGATALP